MIPDRGAAFTLNAVFIIVLLSVTLFSAGCGGKKQVDAKITSLDPASGAYRPGDNATTRLRVQNTGSRSRTLWIGYSVRDHAGEWHDIPARSLELDSGEESESRSMTWKIPEAPAPPYGSYELVVAVWSQRPGTDGARRLTDATRKDAFQLVRFDERFSSPNRSLWQASSSELGRGSLKPENVSVQGGHLKLKLPASSLDGGEIKFEKPYQYGSYRVRMRVADAPSSITGFFLYKPPDFENEIDVEIYNDDSRRILFTTYSNGKQTNTVKKRLSFDPTGDFHEYRFDYYPDKADFYVDGKPTHSFDEGLPEEPMNLFINSWFPTWLPGEKPEHDVYTYVDWIQH